MDNKKKDYPGKGAKVRPGTRLRSPVFAGFAAADRPVIKSWLSGRPAATQAAYLADAGSLFAHTAKPLQEVSAEDLQSYAASLSDFATATQARKLAALKSLFSFGLKSGHLTSDVACSMRLPREDRHSRGRIVTDEEAQRLIILEPNPRNQVLLFLLHAMGLRIGEACGLRWGDLLGSKRAGTLSITRKGAGVRRLDVPAALWKQLGKLRLNAGLNDPVLRSRHGGALSTCAAHRVIKAAAARAGLPDTIASEWLRRTAA